MKKRQAIFLVINIMIIIFSFGYYFNLIMFIIAMNPATCLILLIAIISIITAMYYYFKLCTIRKMNSETYNNNIKLWEKISDLQRVIKKQK